MCVLRRKEYEEDDGKRKGGSEDEEEEEKELAKGVEDVNLNSSKHDDEVDEETEGQEYKVSEEQKRKDMARLRAVRKRREDAKKKRYWLIFFWDWLFINFRKEEEDKENEESEFRRLSF